MTSETTAIMTTAGTLERFPVFQPRSDMQNPIYLHRPAHLASLDIHFGRSQSTLVMGEVPVAWTPGQRDGVRIPDLLVAFHVDPDGIVERRGYAIDIEGKPPDFALEVASASTGKTDYTEKRRDYERYGIAEYWRFDPSGGRYHDEPLAGDRLVEGRYRPIALEWTDDAHCRGYSEALGLYVCWEDGTLRWYDPERGRYLPTFDEETARADRETEARQQEAAARQQETAARQQETEARRQAEAEVRRLRRRLEDLGSH